MSHDEIHSICKKYGIESYTINDDNSIDVNGHVYLISYDLFKLPLNFNVVSGSFWCRDNKLTSLDGSPKKVGRSFDCSYNKLISLKGAPKKVNGYFDCSHNNLTTLLGSPNEVNKNFICSYNKLRNLNHVSLKVGGVFYSICNNVKLDYYSYIKKVKRMNKLKMLSNS